MLLPYRTGGVGTVSKCLLQSVWCVCHRPQVGPEVRGDCCQTVPQDIWDWQVSMSFLHVCHLWCILRAPIRAMGYAVLRLGHILKFFGNIHSVHAPRWLCLLHWKYDSFAWLSIGMAFPRLGLILDLDIHACTCNIVGAYIIMIAEWKWTTRDKYRHASLISSEMEPLGVKIGFAVLWLCVQRSSGIVM